MAGNNATPIQDVLERVVAEAEVAAMQLEVRKAELVEQLRVTNDELRRLTRVVSAAQPQEKEKKAGTSGRARSMYSQKPEATEAVRRAIAKAKGEFSYGSLLEANPDLNKDQVQKALVVMRDRGEIRYLGEKRAPDQRFGKGRKTFSLIS